MTQRLGNPFPMFFDRYGRPLTGGRVYLGEAGEDPELAPVDAFYDAELATTAPQPIPVIGGLLTRDGSPTQIYVSVAQFSVRVRDADGAEVFYVAAANLDADEYQPLDDDLTAISEQTNTDFGLALLTQANGAAVRQYIGVTSALPLAGGTVTGEIVRDDAGAYVYMASVDYPTARLIVTENGAADPRNQVGDIWLEAEA